MSDLEDRIAKFRERCEVEGLTIMYDYALPLLGACQQRIDTDTETIHQLQIEHRRQRERIEELERELADSKIQLDDRGLIFGGTALGTVREVMSKARDYANLESENRKLREACGKALLLRDWVIEAGGEDGALPQAVIHEFAKMQLEVHASMEAALADKGGE